MRLIVEATERLELDCGIDDAWALLRNVPAVLSLLPWLDRVEAMDDEDSAYLFWLGPFGVGGLQGRARCDVVVARRAEATTRVLELTSLGEGDRGNTDCRVEMSLRVAGDRVIADAALWASPRRQMPALLPLSVVRRVADRTVKAGLGDALESVRQQLGA